MANTHSANKQTKGNGHSTNVPAKAAPATNQDASTPAAGFACDVDANGREPATQEEPSEPQAATRAPAGQAAFRVHRRSKRGFEGVAEMSYKPNPSCTSEPAQEAPPGDHDNESDNSPAAGDTRAEAQEAPGWARVVRRELVGRLGPDPCDFHLRHFEVGPGGFSSFEKHRHIHAIIAESGRGEVWLDGKWESISPGDVVYVGPNTPHQLRCPTEAADAFGFFCIVDAVRDRPVVLDERDDNAESGT